MLFNVIAIFFMTSNLFSSAQEVEEEPELQEISWVEVPAAESTAPPQPQPEIQTFPEIKYSPLEIPKLELPKLPDPPTPIAEPVEPPEEVAQPAEKNSVEPAPPEQKPAEMHGVLKVLVKVYPKDLLEQLIASGTITERTAINSGKIVLAVTVGVDGKVKNAEIRRGGGTDERGNLINMISEFAASSWIFEPYIGEDGKPKEMRTQIEFKPEDF